ncbi:peptidylprolyl isomerase [Ideonella sp. A 288]|uniref:peptidylprolyl isomerase n=1 Tax=Ideonella sp. A 288 TaxID=1962181 RepID=UPI000B4B8858|nr:peptidyl-prolyl cis-trans isomerase [Ideonella sp. A 288]
MTHSNRPTVHTASPRSESSPRPWRWSLIGVALTMGWWMLVVAEARAADKDGASAVFARVGDVVISQQAYDQAYAIAARNKFYHGKPPEQEVARLQREVGDSLVNETLLMKEARRRKLQPDHADIAKQLDVYEARYKSSPMWQSNKATVLPPLKKKLEDTSILDQLQASVRKVAEPTERQIEAYYDSHKEKFTEPEQVKISVILLKVDPSSPQAKWNGALEEGTAISKRLRGGADFAALAHLHSGDDSASKGGAMGYTHRGMLPEPAQQAIDKLQPGQVSDAVALLEGVGVFRLEDRKLPKLNPLSAVRQRAKDLLQRDMADQAWTDFLARLRRETPTRIDETRYLPLATPVANARPASK